MAVRAGVILGCSSAVGIMSPKSISQAAAVALRLLCALDWTPVARGLRPGPIWRGLIPKPVVGLRAITDVLKALSGDFTRLGGSLRFGGSSRGLLQVA